MSLLWNFSKSSFIITQYGFFNLLYDFKVLAKNTFFKIKLKKTTDLELKDEVLFIYLI
jgi:hypothetical protein